MKTVACIIARTVSTRLPLKVLRDVVPGTGMLEFIIENIKRKNVVDSIYLCTSNEIQDDILEDLAIRAGISIYRGSAKDVTERMLAVAAIEKADALVRITGDNLFSFIDFIPNQISFLKNNHLDYVRLNKVPIGATCEVFTVQALKKCVGMIDSTVSEYLMLFLFEPRHFACGVITISSTDFSQFSLTVDNPEDLIRSKKILRHLSFNGNNYEVINARNLLRVILTDETLPARTFQLGGTVKLPYEKLITYEEFKMDMDRRLSGSLKLQLND